MMTFVIMAIVGALFLWLGIRSIRVRAWESHVSLIEASILKVADAEPLPLTKFDRIWGRIQAWLMVVIGTLLMSFGTLFVGLSLYEVE